jgi:hypothetical protein
MVSLWDMKYRLLYAVYVPNYTHGVFVLSAQKVKCSLNGAGIEKYHRYDGLNNRTLSQFWKMKAQVQRASMVGFW